MLKRQPVELHTALHPVLRFLHPHTPISPTCRTPSTVAIAPPYTPTPGVSLKLGAPGMQAMRRLDWQPVWMGWVGLGLGGWGQILSDAEQGPPSRPLLSPPFSPNPSQASHKPCSHPPLKWSSFRIV